MFAKSGRYYEDNYFNEQSTRVLDSAASENICHDHKAPFHVLLVKNILFARISLLISL